MSDPIKEAEHDRVFEQVTVNLDSHHLEHQVANPTYNRSYKQ